jgi:hydrogenase nickel incorporation protein HypA/HybF
MHELSIASALIEQVLKHIPPGAKLTAINMEAGPLQGIDQQALDLAWTAVADGTPCQGAKLNIEFLPWPLKCSACGKEFTSKTMPANCECGSADTFPNGGRDLRLVSLDVD